MTQLQPLHPETVNALVSEALEGKDWVSFTFVPQGFCPVVGRVEILVNVNTMDLISCYHHAPSAQWFPVLAQS